MHKLVLRRDDRGMIKVPESESWLMNRCFMEMKCSNHIYTDEVSFDLKDGHGLLFPVTCGPKVTGYTDFFSWKTFDTEKWFPVP